MTLPLKTGRRHGQIIDARQVPHKGWGGDEGPPNFFIVRILDMDYPQVEDWVGWHEELEEKEEAVEGFAIRSKGRIDVSRLPPFHRQKLREGSGRVDITSYDFQAALKDDAAEARLRFQANDPSWPHRISIPKKDVD